MSKDILDDLLTTKSKDLDAMREYIEGSDLWVPKDQDNFGYHISMQPGPVGSPFAWDSTIEYLLWFPGELILDIAPAPAPVFLVGDEEKVNPQTAQHFKSSLVRRGLPEKPLFLLSVVQRAAVITTIKEWCQEQGINVIYQIIESRYESMDHVLVYVHYSVRGATIRDGQCVWHHGMADPESRPLMTDQKWRTQSEISW